MIQKKKIQRGSKQRPRKEYPYFKVQVYEPKLAAWQDLPKAHQSLSEAQAFIGQKCGGCQTRIMIVEGDRNRRVMGG
jgi:hypothetical protein